MEFFYVRLNQSANAFILDVNGQRVYKSDEKNSASTTHTIDLTGFAKGLYFLQLENFNKSETIKLVLK